MVRGGTAAAADQVQQAIFGEASQGTGHVLRRFVVLAEGIGQAGIGVCADITAGDLCKGFHVRAHGIGTQRAVQSDRQRSCMRQRGMEGFRCLPGQGASGCVGDGAGDHHRQARATRIKSLFQRIQRRLGVERVEDGLDHEGVGTAVDQALDRFAVGVAQLVEAGVAEARIIDVGTDRGGAAGGADHPDHEAGLARRGRSHCITAGSRNCGTGLVQFVHQVFEVVVGLADRRGVEGVGLDQIRARFQVGGVDVGDDLRPGQQQQIVVALQVMAFRCCVIAAGAMQMVVAIGEALATVIVFLQAMALDHRTHRAVDDQDPLAQGVEQGVGTIRMQPGQGRHGGLGSGLVGDQ